MSHQFKEQGGAAGMDPSPLKRWLSSKVIMHLNSDRRLEKRRKKAENARQKAGRRHVVDYFHQMEDGYSYLAAQLLCRLAERYDVELRCHLVRGPEGNNAPDAAMLLRLSRYDSSLIASEYGLDFPAAGPSPDKESIGLARAIAASVPQSHLPELLPKVGHALWRNDRSELESLAAVTGKASADTIDSALNAGTELRAKLRHYSGAMFHYEGEWYWGIDRLHYLEERLKALGASRSSGALIAPCPAVSVLDVSNASSLTLEFFPSLRSPYTSIVFDETVALAESTGVNFVMRPVLPMVMRGVPATFEKGFYIFSDTAREARRRGVPYGRFHDPIGNPVRRCYAIYPWAERQGRGAHLLSSFLKHAFAMGVNTDTDRGLKRVVEAAGLDWHAAKTHLDESEWQDILEGNRLSMYEGGLWGVPSYRLIDAEGNVHLEIWGQDRLWLVAREIRRLHKAG